VLLPQLPEGEAGGVNRFVEQWEENDPDERSGITKCSGPEPQVRWRDGCFLPLVHGVVI
jgi:hypothetical protein